MRSDLLDHSSIALRLIAAHMIAGSSLWQVQADPQKAAKPEIEDSLERNTGHRRIETERAAIIDMLAMGDDTNLLDTANAWSPRACIDEVTRILTFLIADSLSAHSPLIDTLGEAIDSDMRTHWIPEPLFFDLVRDKQALNAMVGEYAGSTAARENANATAKTQRAILNACLDGTRTTKCEDWMPQYMAFPMGSYRVETEIVATYDDELDCDIADADNNVPDDVQAKAA